VGVAIRGAQLQAMVPRRLAVRVGQTVTFRSPAQHDIHTVTFGPAALRKAIEADFLGPSASSSVPVFDPLGVYPSEPPGSRSPIAYNGRNHATATSTRGCSTRRARRRGWGRRPSASGSRRPVPMPTTA